MAPEVNRGAPDRKDCDIWIWTSGYSSGMVFRKGGILDEQKRNFRHSAPGNAGRYAGTEKENMQREGRKIVFGNR